MKDLNTRYNQLLQKAAAFHQDHVFHYWPELGTEQRKRLLQQVEGIRFELMHDLAQKHILQDRPAPSRPQFEPVQAIPVPTTEAEKARHSRMAEIGEALLRQGKVGTILVAGGQGTRLGFDAPKGKYPISPVTQKSLFQLHAEKILALGRRYRTSIPWYIMTSETNHEETIEFFQAHRYFGLNESDVFFFKQGMMPALDREGKLIMDRRDHIFMSPDGHGGVFAALQKSGALEDMQQRQLEQLFYFQVDNVLVKICDPVFIGYHIEHKADMSVKVVRKRDPLEKVGVVGKINGKLGIIEYSDMSEEELRATDREGNLLYNAGSIAIHVLARAFIERVATEDIRLPWHVAFKKVPYIDEYGNPVKPAKPNGYKFEQFVFDALQYVNHAVVLEVDRSEEFSPVKNAEGVDSPETARRDLTRLFARWLRAAGFPLPGDPRKLDELRLEISPLYALDEAEFLAKINGAISIDRAFYLG